eukprot:XP_800421.2 PREDICTED: uncharacterized protein LOC586927 [Strongylocentrotus purpuratus]
MDKLVKPSASTSPPTANNGKRGPTCSLSGSSSSEGEGSDHEEIPPSPCSSTSSGPTYVRPPGFKHHGQEIKVQEQRPKVNTSVRIKRKIKRQSMMKDVLPLSHVTSHPVTKVTMEEKTTGVQVLPPSGMKTKVRKEPIPMRLRALPQSFWQQPNTVNSASPGSMYSVLPPLCKMEQSNSDLADIRPVTPPSDGENVESREGDQPDVRLKERKDTLVDRDSLVIKLEKDKERDLSREREVSPRDRDYSPREKDLSPRDRDTGREKESPRDKEKVRDGLKEGAGLESSKQLPPEAKKKQPRPPPRIVRVSPANSELLAKLFEGFDGDGKKKIVRRGRPKREYNPQAAVLAVAAAQTAANTSNNNNTTTPTSGNNASNPVTTLHHPYLTGDDPYMIDSVAEGLLPMLSLESSRQSSGPSSQLAIVTIRGDNNRMLSLPSLSVEQNHSAILSELVKAL